MRTSIFQYPVEQVFLRSCSALSRMGYSIRNIDNNRGTIEAKRRFSFTRPSTKLILNITPFESEQTKVTITAKTKEAPSPGSENETAIREINFLVLLSKFFM